MEPSVPISPLLQYAMWGVWVLIALVLVFGVRAAVQYNRSKRPPPPPPQPPPAEAPAPFVETSSLALPLIAERGLAGHRSRPQADPEKERATDSSLD